MKWFSSKSIRFRIISSFLFISSFILALAIIALEREPVFSSNEVIYLLTVVGLISSIGIAILLSSTIRKSLEGLIENAEIISRGDVDIKVSESGENSIGRLEKAFVTRFGSLKTQTKVVDAIARGNAAKFDGAFREVILVLNRTHEAFVHSFTEVASVISKVSNDDLTVKLENNYAATINILKNNVSKLVESFSAALTDVSLAIQATASASNQISSSSEEMAPGAQEQSRQTIEVTGAVEEMTKTILETTHNSSYAAEAAKNSGTIAREGGTVVNETIEGMNKVAEVVKKTADKVHALGKSIEVEKGKYLAGKSLTEIIDGAEQVVDLSTHVAAASEEQSSVAEDLSKLTVNLQNLISRFKITNPKTRRLCSTHN